MLKKITIGILGLLIIGVLLTADGRWLLRWSWVELTLDTLKDDRIDKEKVSCPDCNVVFVMFDTLRADRFSPYGGKGDLAPAIEKIMGSSLLFENSFSNASFTMPSHMSLFTSTYPTTHQVNGFQVNILDEQVDGTVNKPLSNEISMAGELLKKHGYEMAWSGPIEYRHLDPNFGFKRGFDRFYESPFNRGLQLRTKSTEFNSSLLNQVLDDLEGKKFFLFLHSYINHAPYVYPPEFMAHLSPYYRGFLPRTREQLIRANRRVMRRKGFRFFTAFLKEGERNELEVMKACTDFDDLSQCFDKYVEYDGYLHVLGRYIFRGIEKRIEEGIYETEVIKMTDIREVRAMYDAGVKYLDSQVEKMWSIFQERNVTENTIFVFMGDHGEALYEHGEGSHSKLYDHTIRVPLFIKFPKLDKPVRIRSIAELVDVLPTVFEVLNLPANEQFQGKSLISHDHDGGQYSFGFALGDKYIRSDKWKFIDRSANKSQLFYLPLDPEEQVNLIDYKNPVVKSQLRKLKNDLTLWEVNQSL